MSPATAGVPSDHPRIRGEHGWPRHHIQPHPGSSPHTRGAHCRQHRDGYRVGIIPAYAGSTGPAGRSTPRSADHPRIRGEHLLGETPEGAGVGSSPHTRGARAVGVADEVAVRIIPAYAGSTTRAD